MAEKPLRSLFLEIGLRTAKALQGLKVVDNTFKVVAVSATASAKVIEEAAERVVRSLSAIASGAGAARTAAVGARAGGGGGRRGGGGGGGKSDPLDAAIKSANQSSARQAGFAAGAAKIDEAARALGTFASKSERAKAKVADLTAQVKRNREELADLRAKAIQTGDADGTLAARMQGLSAATNQASVALQGARRELRDLDGGLLKAIKSASIAKISIVAIGTAIGNAITGAVSGAFRGLAGSIVDSTSKAIEFESAFADVKKVLPDNATAEQIKGVEKSIVDLSRRVAVDGPEGAAKLTAALVQTGLYADETGKLSEAALARATEFAAKTGVAFDISAGQAGEGLAKLQTSAGLSQEQVERLAGTINHLSNNMAAKAPEILDASTRIGGIGKTAGVSAETMAALSTAMIAAGGTAETAATGTKNFLRALGAGEAATKDQRAGFKKLGLDAEETAAKFSKGGREAEAVIKDVVERISKVPDENRLATLIQLFGSETIGTIGPLATNIDLLTKSFSLATDEAAALTSVQKEYDARSKTTANAIQLLKNNISALAIQLGQALLPYVNEVVAWLTSPEGQEWGRGAVEKAITVVTGLADAIKNVGEFLAWLTDKLGGTTVAVGALGLAVAALTGPFGLALAAGVAMGAGIAVAVSRIKDSILGVNRGLEELHRKAEDIRRKEREAELDDMHKEGEQASLEIRQKKQAFDAAERWYSAEKKKRGGDADGKLLKRRNAMEAELLSGRSSSGTSFDERLAAFEAGLGGGEATPATGGGGGGGGDKLARFNALTAARMKRKLKPSEQKELNKLSKDLDLAIPDKPGKGHKQTKMDRQLANLDPSLAGVITQGGEEDAGGDPKVAGNVLDRAVYDRATKGKGDGGGSSLGAGPNITSIYNSSTATITIHVDARGEASTADNLRGAAEQVGQRTSRYVITGVEELFAAKHAGGRLRAP